METVTIFLFIILAILNTILFFKVLGMTNNIRDLKHFYMHDKGITEKEIREEDKYLGFGYVDKDDKKILIK